MYSSTKRNSATGFLSGDGDVKALFWAFDWSKTDLGPLSQWSSALRSLVNTILQAPLPMVFLWGPQGIALYNQPFSAIIGDKHPQLLGASILDVWPDMAEINRAVLTSGLQGQAISYHDQPLFIQRNNEPERIWVDLNYTPVMDERNKPVGVLGVVMETTRRVQAELERLRAEERLEVAKHAAGMVGVWDWDVQSDRIYADARFCALYSVPPERGAEGAPLSEYFAALHPDDVERVNKAARQVIETGEPYSIEYRLIQKDGSTRWVIAQGQCQYDEQGRPTRFPGVVMDITGRKIAEQALQESEARFRTMAASIPQLSWMTGPDGAVFWYNERWYEYTGATPEESLGWDWMRFHHPDYVEAVKTKFQHALACGEPWEDTFPLRGKDGQYRWFLSRAMPWRDETGRIVRWFGTNTDITEQLEIAEALKRSETRLKAYVHQQDAIARLGMQAMSGTQDMAAITRLAAEMVADTLGCDFSKVLQHVSEEGDKFRLMAVCGFDQVLVGQEVDFSLEPQAAYALRNKAPVVVDDIHQEARFGSGQVHAMHGLTSGLAVMIYAGGKPFGVLQADSVPHRLFTESDVHFMQATATLIGTVIERKFGEEALARQHELVQEYAARLEASNRDLSQFASVVSHDLQAPLRKIFSFGEFLKDREAERLSQQGRDYIDRMQRSAERMQALITDLLALSRVDRSQNAFTKKDFGQIVATVCEDLALEIKESGAQVRIDTSCEFEADGQQMVQMMTNLLGNALKYHQPERPPEIRLACEVLNPHFVQLSIRDNGIGIAPENHDKIFEIFQRLHADHSFSGTGIGLAIVKRIVDRHRGNIRVESAPGKGCTFIIKLPMRQNRSDSPLFIQPG